MANKHSRLKLSRLEDRTVPSVTNYYPPSNYLVNHNFSADAARLDNSAPLDIALTYLRDHAADFGATAADMANPIVTSQYSDRDTGTSHIYLRQRVNGLGVSTADLNVSVAANGQVISAGGGFVSNLNDRVGASRATTAILTPVDAVRRAADQLGLPTKNAPVVVNPQVGPTFEFRIAAPTVSEDDVRAKLQYVPTPDGSAVLAWDLIVRTPDGEHWYDVSVDASTGSIVSMFDWMSEAGYHVVPLPNESPVDGGTFNLSNRANDTASPFGWHDTNGAAGAEFTDTRGNNVDAHLDRNADDEADIGSRPDGGAGLDFTGYTPNLSLSPNSPRNQSAAVVNLFAVNNMIHDIQYQYGFTELAGNFQLNNYGKGGAGNDAVQADAQDGSGTSNANFGTPNDGFAPRMQMYEWTNTNPRRDSDFDNGVIIHEYGHGVSNRLTGGPANSNALSATQSGGMGEGWSDFFALMFQQRPTDTKLGSYGIGTYLRGQPITGTGIRVYPYSYNVAIDPIDWDSYGTSGSTTYGLTRSTAVHRSGTIWSSALWDLNQLLIDKYGFDSNLLTGWSPNPGPANAGNKLALRLVVEAMKLQPALPTFVQARDAIISADIALNGGNDLFEIWSAFSRRNLGTGAATSSASATTMTLSTAMPMLVSSVTPATNAIVTSAPTSFVVNVTAPVTTGSVQSADLTVNGISASSVTYTAGQSSMTFSFAASPVSAEGSQSIKINSGAFTRASDASSVAKFGSTFFFDPTPITVTSISPTPGSILAVPVTTIDVNFNSAIDPSSVSLSDLTLTQGNVTGFTMLNGDKTVQFAVADLVNEGQVYVAVAHGAFADGKGNPNAAFAGGGSYTLDYGVTPFPVPLVANTLPGSLVYERTAYGNVGYSGDADSITINLDANQSLSVIISPSETLTPSINVTGPGTNQTNTAGSAGTVAQLRSIPITTAGTYSLIVGGAGATTGNFDIQVIVNSAGESATTNDTLATAQSLNAAFIDLGANLSAATMRGRSEPLPTSFVNEVEPNGTTASANNGAKYYASKNNNIYQMGISGGQTGTTDSDFFNVGFLDVGDVLIVAEGGSNTSRGTQTDTFVELWRAGSGSEVAFDDDSGPATDSLLYRYTITVADTYYVRGNRFDENVDGTYQLGIWLENMGSAPLTGGTFTAEAEPNETTATANNAANAWRPLNYLASANGSIGAGDTDIYSYTFTAGDVVTLITQSTSLLIGNSALLNSSGTVIATDNGVGTSGTAFGTSPIYGYVIPTNGTYYFRVTGGSSTTGSYVASVYRSSVTAVTVEPNGLDLYSFSLATGESANVVLKTGRPGTLDVEILDSGGSVVASGVVGATNFDAVASVVAGTPGTYYVRVSGAPEIDYEVTVVTGGTFDAEANDSFATAQSFGPELAALGAISDGHDWYRFAVAAGNIIALETTTPGGGGDEFVNLLDPRIELYDPDNVLVDFDDDSAGDGRNAMINHLASKTGNYRVRITGEAGTTGEYVLNADVNTAAAKIADVEIGDGTNQRSRITQLVVTFNQPVILPGNPEDAFLLVRQDDSTTVGLNAVLDGTNTFATITFDAGTAVEFDSLADGRYTFTVLAAQVNAGNFDGDGNGTPGDDYVLASDAYTGAPPNYTPPTNIFRLYGDIDGNGLIDLIDFGGFRTAFTPNYLAAFDYDGLGTVDLGDLGQFRPRFGVMI